MVDIDQAVPKVQEKVGQLIQEANPNLSEEVKGNIIRGVGQNASELFQQMKDNPNMGSCAVISGIFKDKADKNYGGYQIAFDKQGNAIFENKADGQATMAIKPGDPNVNALKDIISQDSKSAQNISQGYRDVRVGAVACPPPKP